MLVQVVDLSQVDPAQPLAPLHELEEELQAGDPSLLNKPRLIALNKVDLVPPDFPLEAVTAAYAGGGRQVLVVSGLTGTGLTALRQAIAAEMARLRAANKEFTASEPDFHGIKPG
jgi:GTP-binding protein